jgi:Putative transposase
VACKPGFLRPGRHLSDLFRRLFLEGLTAAFDAGKLRFFAELVDLKEQKAFAAAIAPLRSTEWVVYAKEAWGGPRQVLAYLARYSHRVAISNNRLVDLDETHVAFRSKVDRETGSQKSKVVRLEIAEFIRRFLLHILPDGFQRIRHYGFLANSHRADKLAVCRRLLDLPPPSPDCSNDDGKDPDAPDQEPPPCPCCGGRMKIIERFEGSVSRPYHVRRLDAL